MSIFFKNTPKGRRDLFAAIDIGSSKVCCAIARVDERANGEVLRIIGSGYQHSQGVKNSVITNLEALEDSILNALHSAEQMAEETITEVYVNISASCTQSHTVEVELDIENTPVEDRHIRQLLHLGRGDFSNEIGQIIHILPISYAIDGEVGIRDPRGLYGKKLTASLHVVSVTSSVMRNIENCIARCHLDIVGFAVSSYASGLATLVDDELELGVTVIDFGAHSCDIASFLDGSLIHVDSLSLGGAHITSDIARGLSTPLVQAERLKTLYGTTITSSADDRESILVPQLGEGPKGGPNQISKALLTHIIRARSDEILDLVWKRLQQSGIDRIVGQRIVLTGGSSQLSGFRELASQKWQRQIRIGMPIGFSGGGDVVSTPMFSTCGGLLKFAMRDYLGEETPIHPVYSNNFGLTGKIMGWIRENF
jgi:cell division protein FtsA